MLPIEENKIGIDKETPKVKLTIEEALAKLNAFRKEFSLQEDCISFTTHIFSVYKNKHDADPSTREEVFARMTKFKNDLLALVNAIEE